MAIDFEDTSFGFNRRKEFVESLEAAKRKVTERLQHPGRESADSLHRLNRALDEVMNDQAFQLNATATRSFENDHRTTDRSEHRSTGKPDRSAER